MRLLVSIALAVGLSGCSWFQKNQVLCDLGKSVSSLVAAQVATQLTCKNLDAVKADLDAQIAKIKISGTGICEMPAPAPQPVGAISAQGAIGDVICGPVVDSLAAGLLVQIPAAWGCTGGPLTDTIKLQLLTACKKAI